MRFTESYWVQVLVKMNRSLGGAYGYWWWGKPRWGRLGINGGKKLGGHHRSCGFRDGSFLQLRHHPHKLSDNRYCDERDLIFLMCHKNTCLNGHYGWKLLTLGLHTVLMALGIVVVGIKRCWFVTWSQKTTCLKGCVSLRVETPHIKPPPGHV